VEALVGDVGVAGIANESFIVVDSSAVSTEIVDRSAEEVVGVVFEGVAFACSIGFVVGEVLAVVVGLKIFDSCVFLLAWT